MLLALNAHGAGESLVPNGSFEEATQNGLLKGLPAAVREFYAGTADAPFEGWAFGGKWEKGEYRVAVSNEAHSGRQSCQMTCIKRGRGGIACAPIKLNPGEIIKVTLWCKAKDANGGRIFLNFEGSPGDGWTSKDLKVGTYDWTQFSKRAVVPPHPTLSPQGRGKGEGQGGGAQTIAVFVYTTCEGSVWIDDFTVEKVDVNAMAEAPDEPAAGPRMPKPIPEPAGSIGYRVAVVSALEKVFREDDYAPMVRQSSGLSRRDPEDRGTDALKADLINVSAARNEFESMQVVLEAPWRAVTIKEIVLSELKGPGGATIPAAALKWERVEYIETTVTPPYFAERGLGSYPDPLLPAGEFTINKLSRGPVWITLKTPKDCPAGVYTGTVSIVPGGLRSAGVPPAAGAGETPALRPTTIPISLTVWDFALSDQTHLRTLTWFGGGLVREIYGNDWSPEGEKRHAAVCRDYESFLLEHRLGPGGECASTVFKGKDGKYNFAPVDRTLERLLSQGMNAFIMGTAPNLRRQKLTEYSAQFVKDFSEMTKAYGDHLREKGWADMAYVYVYDEAPRSAWPEVKKIDKAIKAAAPEARILQCLNEPEGVRELTGYADVFDVYVAQYHKAGVAASQKKGAEVWLAICCYPMDHPNFFIEYPLLDERVTPWICWKYKANGFEYWSANAWGVNASKKGDRWPKVPWVANSFGRYNGDGYLMYPGEGGKPWSSIRFEALRDGFEDYEYLWTLNELLKQAENAKQIGEPLAVAHNLLSLDELVKETGSYDPDPEKYVAFRRQLAEAIVQLKGLIERK